MFPEFDDDFHRESFFRFLEQQREEAEKSYEGLPESEKRYCPYCGELMKWASISYFEGFHIDSCY
jgi:hypothetical protein